MLAGIGAGLWTPEATRRMLRIATRFEPTMSEADRAGRLAQWQDAVQRTRTNA
jgi:glycerol kinase